MPSMLHQYLPCSLGRWMISAEGPHIIRIVLHLHPQIYMKPECDPMRFTKLYVSRRVTSCHVFWGILVSVLAANSFIGYTTAFVFASWNASRLQSARIISFRILISYYFLNFDNLSTEKSLESEPRLQHGNEWRSFGAIYLGSWSHVSGI